jgi:hypothetical protein
VDTTRGLYVTHIESTGKCVREYGLVAGEEDEPWNVEIKLLFFRWLSPFLKLV